MQVGASYGVLILISCAPFRVDALQDILNRFYPSMGFYTVLTIGLATHTLLRENSSHLTTVYLAHFILVPMLLPMRVV